MILLALSPTWIFLLRTIVWIIALLLCLATWYSFDILADHELTSLARARVSAVVVVVAIIFVAVEIMEAFL